MSAAATTTKDNGPIIACGTPASKKARCSSSNNNDDEHGMSEETPPVVIIASQHSMSESALLLSPTDTAATATATATEQQDVGNRTGKREDYLSWDDYFMAVAFLSAQRSKDPSTQVGACIVNKQKRVIGIGYNGFPKGCSDDVLPWARVPPEHGGGGELDTKYPYVTHAEVNAILNKCSADVAGATIYVALFPCNECAKVIIQSGIEEVVYMSDKYHHTDSCRASRRMFELAGVRTRQHKPERRQITIDFGPLMM